MPNLTISQALAQADLLVDRPTIDKAIAGIADAIARDYKGEVPLFLSIMHGALPFAGQLALELGARGQDVQFDYLHATRYRGETTGGDLVWKHKPATSLFGRRVLLIDDILDEGYTLQGVRTWCLEQGATDAHRRDDREEARPRTAGRDRRLRDRAAGPLRVRLRHGRQRDPALRAAIYAMKE